ncbi:hypothetical protein QBC43DRAFT_353693 [Cladorrhinum sp. PSN259]|nr:hypothetical protein QBC43DRAFT_353693 [Cladorrhinum sp. PSN259]
MVKHLYLVAYHEKGRRPVPAHWALLLTDDDDVKEGPVYHAVGSPFTGYQVEVKPRYNLELTTRRHSTILLGVIHDGWVAQLATMAHQVAAPGISSTPLDAFAGKNCQNWVSDFIDYLIEQGVIDSTARNNLSSAPKV